jgi:hypothetical protein
MRDFLSTVLRAGTRLPGFFFRAIGWQSPFMLVLLKMVDLWSPAMRTDVSSTLQQGVRYSNTWPLMQELNGLFPENRLIRLTLFLKMWMPPLAVLSVCVQLQYFGAGYVWPALSCGLFLLALPLQGYYWLGLRAQTALPPAIHRWYQDIRTQMQQAGVQVPQTVTGTPCYADLANVLQSAFRQLDKAFFHHWL